MREAHVGVKGVGMNYVMILGLAAQQIFCTRTTCPKQLVLSC